MSKEEILQCNFNPTHTKNMQIHIRIFAPTYLTHAPPPSPPKKKPLQGFPKTTLPFCASFSSESE